MAELQRTKMTETTYPQQPKVAASGAGAQPPTPPSDGPDSYYDSGDMGEWRKFNQDGMQSNKKPMHHHRQQFDQPYGGRVAPHNNPKNNLNAEQYPTGRAGDR